MLTKVLTYRESEFDCFSFEVFEVDLDPDYKQYIVNDQAGTPCMVEGFDSQVFEAIDGIPSIASGGLILKPFKDSMAKAGIEQFKISNHFDCSDEAYAVMFLLKSLVHLHQVEFYMCIS